MAVQHHPATTEVESPPRDDARWLALLLLKACLLIANGIRREYGLSRGETCGRCGHKF